MLSVFNITELTPYIYSGLCLLNKIVESEKSPRRLRAKYTHYTNCVYTMGISLLLGLVDCGNLTLDSYVVLCYDSTTIRRDSLNLKHCIYLFISIYASEYW